MGRSGLEPPDVAAIVIELMTIAHSHSEPGLSVGRRIDQLDPAVQRDVLLQSVAMLKAANNMISDGLGVPVDHWLKRIGLLVAQDRAK